MTDKAKPKHVRFTTPPFVLSYPHLFVAQKASDDKNAKASYSACAIWRPSTFSDADKKLWNAINAEIVRVCVAAKWPGGVKCVAKSRKEVHEFLQKKFPQSCKVAIRSGEDERPDKAGYGPGTLFANMRTDSPPGVVDLSKSKIHPSEGNADEIYPGAICRATITIFAYPDGRKDNGGRGYSFGLGNVQKIKDGPRLDSRVAAEDDFDEEVDGAWLDEVAEPGEDDGDASPKAEDDFG